MIKYFLLFLLCDVTFANSFDTEDELAEFIHGTYTDNITSAVNNYYEALWNYQVDLGDTSKFSIMLEKSVALAQIRKYFYETYFKDIDADDYTNETIKNEIKRLQILGTDILDSEDLSEYINGTKEMQDIYNKARICPYSKQDCDLESEGWWYDPEIKERFRVSKDYSELLYIWVSWRDATGAKMIDLFKSYVTLSNKAAIANGFENMGQIWIARLESESLHNQVDTLWSQIEPIYDALHTYVANKLKSYYGDSIDISDGLIPAHVLGENWAKTWRNLEDLVIPYPNATSTDISLEAGLKNNNYTVLDIFDSANDFLVSLGFNSTTQYYDEGSSSIIYKLNDTDMVCRPSTWNFLNGSGDDDNEQRIRMCASVSEEDYDVIHQQLSYISYGAMGHDRSGGSHPGHPSRSAISELVSLSSTTSKHLQAIDLIDKFEETDQTQINALMKTALDVLPFLPFAYQVFKWRMDVFNETVSSDDWNSHWWIYRESIQKIKAPVSRSDSDLDPCSLYAIPGEQDYISVFLGNIIQFQMYKKLCIAAEQYDPTDSSSSLYNCDIYRSEEAGSLLKQAISSDGNWEDMLYSMTGEKSVDVSALIQYFKPLYDWLQVQNSS